MSQTLLIPIHVDALCLDSDQAVVGTMVDYKNLPYIYQGHTYPAALSEKVYNLSENVLAGLFEGSLNLTLKAGIHLHWALPDGLTNGEHDDSRCATRLVQKYLKYAVLAWLKDEKVK